LIIVRTERWLAAAAVVCGTAAWIVYFQHDLVLSHYDAKAHLVVARRVIDSLTPGWQQFGAVWLPLPHLLQVLPTQVDWLYRTGLFASLLSIAAFAVSVWATARLVLALTGSALGAAVAGLLLLLNTNLLYLHSTPMTEPLLLATTLIAVLWTYEWLSRPSGSPTAMPARVGWALFAAMWTRYEAWPIVTAVIVLAAFARWRPETKPGLVSDSAAPDTKPGFFLPAVLRLACWPLAAAALFALNSRITVGSWFVTGGFYERDPFYDGNLWRSIVAVWWGTHRLSGYAIETVALVAVGVFIVQALRRGVVARLVPVALFAAAALPAYAFYQGHPYRVRYMVPAVVACALFCGVGVGQVRSAAIARALAGLLIASLLVESPVGSSAAPMLEEAQWDAPRSRERRAITACLVPEYRGEKVLASMGSLAHYMQELSHDGFGIADFVHEGNGSIWQLAVQTGPAPHAGWMLIEEQAEGGDVLAQRVHADAGFIRGMVRVCEGGGVALYRRTGGSGPDAITRAGERLPDR
jgi:hypothetical protein